MMTHESWFMRYLLRAMIHVIVLVCVFDMYLTVKYHDSILTLEQNPVAMWFINTRSTCVSNYTDDLGGHHAIVHYSVDVSLLILMKTLGMMIGLAILQYIANNCRCSIAVTVISSVFLFQLCLLLYLVL